MHRFALLAPLAFLLSACGDCDCCKKEPVKDLPVAAAPVKSDEPAADTPIEDAAVRKAPEVKVAWRGAGDTVELSVWEMHCMGCAGKVEEAFAAVPGVKSAEADYDTSVVRVTLVDAAQRDAVIARLPAALKALNESAGKEFRVLGL